MTRPYRGAGHLFLHSVIGKAHHNKASNDTDQD